MNINTKFGDNKILGLENFFKPSEEFNTKRYVRARDWFKKCQETNITGQEFYRCSWCSKIITHEDLKWRFGVNFHCSLNCFRNTRDLVQDLFNCSEVF